MRYKIIVMSVLSFLIVPIFNAECKDEFLLNQAQGISIYFSGEVASEEDSKDKVKLNISNILDDFFFVITNETTNERNVYKDIENGFLSIETPSLNKRYEYTVRVYSSSTECENELLRTEKLVSLKYNAWSNSTECKELRENSIKQNDGEVIIPACCEYFSEKEYLEKDFIKEYYEFVAKLNEPSVFQRILEKFYKYYYFALIPILVLTVYYLYILKKIKVRKKVQDEE